jgi:hypothetical protein
MALRESVSLPLAVHDVAPVALAGVATTLVARRSRWSGAYVGAVMVTAGGLGKAVWKLLVALDVADWPRLADALFPLLGPGFVLLALAAWGHRSRSAVAGTVAAAAVGLAIPSIADIYLPVTVLGATSLYAALARDARRSDDTVTLVLLGASLLATYALGPLSAGEQTLAAQWVEQSVNTVNQAAFALAAWRLRHVPPALAPAVALAPAAVVAPPAAHTPPTPGAEPARS